MRKKLLFSAALSILTITDSFAIDFKSEQLVKIPRLSEIFNDSELQYLIQPILLKKQSFSCAENTDAVQNKGCDKAPFSLKILINEFNDQANHSQQNTLFTANEKTVSLMEILLNILKTKDLATLNPNTYDYFNTLADFKGDSRIFKKLSKKFIKCSMSNKAVLTILQAFNAIHPDDYNKFYLHAPKLLRKLKPRSFYTSAILKHFARFKGDRAAFVKSIPQDTCGYGMLKMLFCQKIKNKKQEITNTVSVNSF